MILLSGGAYQGKTAYAMKHFQSEITDGSFCEFHDAKSAKILKNYHILVRRLLESGNDAVAYTNAFCKSNPDCIVLINEVGSGIIPMGKTDRVWRETVGRCGCILASQAEIVLRFVCGIPTTIKGEKL